MFNDTVDKRHIQNLFINYYEIHKRLGLGQQEDERTISFISSLVQRMDREGIVFHHVPLLAQQFNDCWLKAAEKIVGHHLKPFDLLKKWKKNPVQNKDQDPWIIWQKNEGLHYDLRAPVMQSLGFKPLPNKLIFDFVEEERLYNCYLPRNHPKQRIFKNVNRYEKELVGNDFKKYLKSYGPLWTSIRFSDKNSSIRHVMVLMGSSDDYLIFSDTSRNKDNLQKCIKICSIKDFNKMLSPETNEPIWYYPTPQWAGDYILA